MMTGSLPFNHTHPGKGITHMPTASRRAAVRPEVETDRYLAELHRHLSRLLPRMRSTDDRDDVVQDELLIAAAVLDVLMERYPDPGVYASVRAKGGRAIISWQRRQGTQRGTGSRFRRAVTSFDALDGDNWIDRCDPERADWSPLASLALDDRLLLESALALLDERQRKVLFLIDLLGYHAGEVGEMLGHARETITKIRGRALQQLRNACFTVAA